MRWPVEVGWITGSVTPNWSMRLRIVVTAWLTAPLATSLASLSFMVSTRSSSCRFTVQRGMYFEARSLTLSRTSGGAVITKVESPVRRPLSPAAPLSLPTSISRAMSESVSARRASSVWTWRSRCMPPLRSRPRLIFSLGG